MIRVLYLPVLWPLEDNPHLASLVTTFSRFGWSIVGWDASRAFPSLLTVDESRLSKRRLFFRDLPIISIDDSLSSVKTLVSWAKRLESFHCSNVEYKRDTWDFEAYASILAPQINALKILSLGHYAIGKSKTGIIQKSMFPNVEILSLLASYVTCTPKGRLASIDKSTAEEIRSGL